MCRIGVGCTIDNFQAEYLPHAVMDAMLDMSSKSNRDGFGAYFSNVGSDLPSVMYKKAKPCENVILTPDYFNWEVSNNSGYGPFMFHVRQATTGKGEPLNDAYAHPFQLGNFTLVHNGHLINAYDVKKDLNIPNQVTVDSEIFLHALNIQASGKDLNLEIIQKTIDLFVGPFVFVVHEKDSDFLWLILGKGRTLHHYDHPDFVVVLTDSGYAYTLTHGVYRNAYANTWMELTPFKIAEKLHPDFVYQLGSKGLIEIGKINSIEETPKVVNTPSTSRSTTVAPAVNSSADAISLKSVIENIELREVTLKNHGLSSDDLQNLLDLIYPLLPVNIYALTNDYLTVVDGFLTHSGILPEAVEERKLLWLDFISKIGDQDPYDYIKSFGNNAFINPYFMNSADDIRNLTKVLA